MALVSVYIDGFNLYHALLQFRDPKVKWLDLRALSERLINPKSDKIVAINYFSAYADWLPDPKSRHEIYVEALKAKGIIPILGHFKVKNRKCFKCNTEWKGHEEKETDVNIAISMLNDAYKNVYEKALLLTRDSDLVPAVKMIRAEFPKKEIVVVAPPFMGHSNDLLKVCNSKKKITPDQVRQCLLPREVKGPSGKTVALRPKNYD